MSNGKPLPSFEIELTADGSPTLRLPGQEPMHSLQGALAETRFIYEPVVDFSMDLEGPKILSVGLGLGYNEILSAAKSLAIGKEFELLSLESEEWLRREFQSWIIGQPGALGELYDQITGSMANAFGLASEGIRGVLKSHLEDEALVLAGALSIETTNTKPWNGILYDAFSLQTNPELWTEDFLKSFFRIWPAPRCAVATYAATGNLKRALKQNGFELTPKAGFGKKRESTFATRTH